MYKSVRSSCVFVSFLYKLLAFSFAFVIYCPVIASAAQVTLEWDENSEADLAGYRVFCRQDGQDYDYYNPAWEGTETTCTIFDLNDNTRYYIVARAVNILDNESGNSNEVFFQFEDPSGTCTDADDDGYYAESGCGSFVDCNDNDPSINPGATEICDDNKDNDCNGAIDCYDPNCDCDIPNDDINPEGPADDLIVSNVTVDSGEDYEVVDYGLNDGAFAYIDRSYRFTDIPAYLDGATYIKTANDDKASVGDDFYSFDVNQDVTVYVAHDDLIKDKPSWLLDFTDTGDQLVTTDKSLSIYARDFSAGTVTLGGNDGPGNSMYVVALVTVSGPADSGPADDLTVSNITVDSGEDYEVVDYGLNDGALVYIDRSYRFTDIPAYLDGATYIKTANDDKGSVGDDFYSFDVNQDVTVYVAYDDLIKDKPSWLLDFTDTGDQLVTTDIDTTDKSFSVYARDFSAGTITLGGNDGPGHSMYMVVLVGR